MPFRAKLKKTFGGKKSGENSPSGETTPNGQRSDIEYYKPHEIPKSKYRGRIDPEHQEKLHAFSFADAFGRRASSVLSGAFSPRGTHAQSRRASMMSRTKSSASHVSEKDSKSLRRKSVVPDQVKESENEDMDAANVELAREQTVTTVKAEDRPEDVKLEKARINDGLEPQNDVPFSAEELEKAMTKVTLKPGEGADAVAVQ